MIDSLSNSDENNNLNLEKDLVSFLLNLLSKPFIRQITDCEHFSIVNKNVFNVSDYLIDVTILALNFT